MPLSIRSSPDGPLIDSDPSKDDLMQPADAKDYYGGAGLSGKAEAISTC